MLNLKTMEADKNNLDQAVKQLKLDLNKEQEENVGVFINLSNFNKIHLV